MAHRTSKSSRTESQPEQGVGLKQRVTLRVPLEAAAALGVSSDYFSDHVRDDLKLIKRGRLTLVSVAELERWAASAK